MTTKDEFVAIEAEAIALTAKLDNLRTLGMHNERDYAGTLRLNLFALQRACEDTARRLALSYNLDD